MNSSENFRRTRRLPLLDPMRPIVSTFQKVSTGSDQAHRWENLGLKPQKGAAMKKSGTGIRGRQSALPAPRHLPLVDILVDAQAELQELVVASGLKVLAAMLEADRVAVCGPR